MALDDRLLLARIATGDEDALHELYQGYAPRLTRYLWHQLDGDQHAVEEALQEEFIAVWRSAAGFRGEAKVATWVYQIAHNAASSARRRQLRQAVQWQVPIPEPDEATEGGEALPACDDAVLDRLVLADALRQLSEKHREVLQLIAAEGFSLDEAARMLDIPSGTVKSRLSYARRALLRALSARDPEASHS
ncbi:MAG TPA: RNA polymerase sigma factor [Ktedonobacterales bacterium]|nr:RNA polymerase sigma factor [Ktedonobacterales bacterium]